MLSYFIIVFLSSLVIVAWLWRYKIKPYLAKKKMYQFLKSYPQGIRIESLSNFLNTLYAPINATHISLRERKRLGIDEDAFTYGEIDFMSFMFVLSKIQINDHEIFYDLGSGTGRAVLTAALWKKFSKVYGVELLPGLCDIAIKQTNKAYTLRMQNHDHQNLQSIEFLQTDFKSIDFADANIIFINATCLSYPTWEWLLKKFSRLKSGTRIIITTKKILLKEFTLVYHDFILMSWGVNSISIYKKN